MKIRLYQKLETSAPYIKKNNLLQQRPANIAYNLKFVFKKSTCKAEQTIEL